MSEGTPTLPTGAEIAAQRPEGALRHIAGGVGHVVAEGAHVVVGLVSETASVLSMRQFSSRAEVAVAHASIDRRSEEARMTTADAMRGDHPTWAGR